MIIRSIFSVFFFVFFLTGTALANQHPGLPDGPVILTISGKISVSNKGDSLVFDRTMLQSQKWTQFETPTAWTSGTPMFEGVLLRDLLKIAGAKGTRIVATALNDYAVTIPWSHIDEHPVLLAMKMNGKFMRVRDKGPIWIIYPMPSAKAAKGNPLNKYMVWQLDRLSIE